MQMVIYPYRQPHLWAITRHPFFAIQRTGLTPTGTRFYTARGSREFQYECESVFDFLDRFAADTASPIKIFDHHNGDEYPMSWSDINRLDGDRYTDGSINQRQLVHGFTDAELISELIEYHYGRIAELDAFRLTLVPTKIRERPSKSLQLKQIIKPLKPDTIAI